MDAKTAALFLERLRFFGDWTLRAENREAVLIPIHKLDIPALEMAIATLKEKELIESRVASILECLMSCDE